MRTLTTPVDAVYGQLVDALGVPPIEVPDGPRRTLVWLATAAARETPMIPGLVELLELARKTGVATVAQLVRCPCGATVAESQLDRHLRTDLRHADAGGIA